MSIARQSNRKIFIIQRRFFAMKGNVIVGQSGGPTAVINSSLAGVYRTAIDRGAKKVYGMRFGIQGLLDEQYVDLSKHIKNDLDVEILKRTPSAFLGTCRYKLPDIHENQDIYVKIFDILEKLNIECFIYIGGNDSMDTIKKLSDYAILTGKSQKFVGVPKTIDNDLALTDHTPGYGSAAKYIATSTKEVIRDGLGFSYKKKLVTIIEIMGRNAGWLTGASALSKGEDCDGPDLIYLPEVAFEIDKFVFRVRKLLEKKDVVVIAISEGIRTEDGKYISELSAATDYVDAFGHKQLTGSASYLANVINQQIGCKARAVEFSTLQRSDRVSDDPYQSATGIYDVHKIANGEKLVPRDWITKDGTYVTEEFIDYVRPLIQGDSPCVMVGGIPRHLYMSSNRGKKGE